MSFISLTVFSQNTCNTAAPVTAGPTYTIPVINGTDVAPDCVGNGVATLAEWYVYTATADYTVTVTSDLPANAGQDTRFHVYSGNCGALVCEGGDDDSGGGFLSEGSFNAYNGNTYYIAFDNRWEADGLDFQLSEAPLSSPPFVFTNEPITTSGSYKNCVVDMNGDCLDDMVTINNPGSRVYIYEQQPGGGFIERTRTISPAATFRPSWSIAAGDYDDNGYTDLMFGAGSGVSFARASSDGTSFTGISGPEYVFSQRTNFADIDKDGNLDAFVCHDVGPNQYYINDGAGNLVHGQGGLGDAPTGGNYASVWIDYDNDGDSDMFIAKCNGGGAAASARYNELFRNNGNGTYTDVSVASGLYDPIQTWSSAWGDYDNNGWMDVYVGASSFVDGSHKLMRNNGDGTFTDITAGSGVDMFTGTGIEHMTHDFDNDGYLDIFTAGNTILHNNQDMTFTEYDVGFSVGAVGDLNDDGFLDVFTGNSWRRNNGNGNNWIRINTIGAVADPMGSNRNGIGARVQITSALGSQIRDVKSGDGFGHMGSIITHFGLGSDTSISELRITWPSGIVDVINNPTINTKMDVIEGSTLSIDDYTLDDTILYPNPTHDYINIANLNLEETSVVIHDILGKRLFNFTVENNQINVKNLATGTYILMLQQGNKLAKHKFIKQ
ncbi:MAG: VCBS repeat-containing protein [Flavobacteriaceae bacterium]|nr:VCBS repeat-containing protein [Flavobacteriaceae bacterium]